MKPLLIPATATLLLVPQANAQSMLESIRQPWQTYVFVSTRVPHESLVSLAREASQAKATMVLRGFAGEPVDLGAMQRFVADIDTECCGTGLDKAHPGPKVAWVIDPRLFDRYRVTAAPAFVLSRGEGTREDEYSRVQGDMALANALKTMAQESGSGPIRERAAEVYSHAYGGTP